MDLCSCSVISTSKHLQIDLYGLFSVVLYLFDSYLDKFYALEK